MNTSYIDKAKIVFSDTVDSQKRTSLNIKIAGKTVDLLEEKYNEGVTLADGRKVAGFTADNGAIVTYKRENGNINVIIYAAKKGDVDDPEKATNLATNLAKFKFNTKDGVFSKVREVTGDGEIRVHRRADDEVRRALKDATSEKIDLKQVFNPASEVHQKNTYNLTSERRTKFITELFALERKFKQDYESDDENEPAFSGPKHYKMSRDEIEKFEKHDRDYLSRLTRELKELKDDLTVLKNKNTDPNSQEYKDKYWEVSQKAGEISKALVAMKERNKSRATRDTSEDSADLSIKSSPGVERDGILKAEQKRQCDSAVDKARDMERSLWEGGGDGTKAYDAFNLLPTDSNGLALEFAENYTTRKKDLYGQKREIENDLTQLQHDFWELSSQPNPEPARYNKLVPRLVAISDRFISLKEGAEKLLAEHTEHLKANKSEVQDPDKPVLVPKEKPPESVKEGSRKNETFVEIQKPKDKEDSKDNIPKSNPENEIKPNLVTQEADLKAFKNAFGKVTEWYTPRANQTLGSAAQQAMRFVELNKSPTDEEATVNRAIKSALVCIGFVQSAKDTDNPLKISEATITDHLKQVQEELDDASLPRKEKIAKSSKDELLLALRNDWAGFATSASSEIKTLDVDQNFQAKKTLTAAKALQVTLDNVLNGIDKLLPKNADGIKANYKEEYLKERGNLIKITYDFALSLKNRIKSIEDLAKAPSSDADAIDAIRNHDEWIANGTQFLWIDLEGQIKMLKNKHTKNSTTRPVVTSTVQKIPINNATKQSDLICAFGAAFSKKDPLDPWYNHTKNQTLRSAINQAFNYIEDKCNADYPEQKQINAILKDALSTMLNIDVDLRDAKDRKINPSAIKANLKRIEEKFNVTKLQSETSIAQRFRLLEALKKDWAGFTVAVNDRINTLIAPEALQVGNDRAQVNQKINELQQKISNYQGDKLEEAKKLGDRISNFSKIVDQFPYEGAESGVVNQFHKSAEKLLETIDEEFVDLGIPESQQAKRIWSAAKNYPKAVEDTLQALALFGDDFDQSFIPQFRDGDESTKIELLKNLEPTQRMIFEQQSTDITARHLSSLGDVGVVPNQKSPDPSLDALQKLGLTRVQSVDNGHCLFDSFSKQRESAKVVGGGDDAETQRASLIKFFSRLRPEQAKHFKGPELARVWESLNTGLGQSSTSSLGWGTSSHLSLKAMQVNRPMIAITDKGKSAMVYNPDGTQSRYALVVSEKIPLEKVEDNFKALNQLIFEEGKEAYVLEDTGKNHWNGTTELS